MNTATAQMKILKNKRIRSTIGLKASTKERIDRFRAPGQCYDGFIRQLVDYWEKSKNDRLY
ncbi:MAG: hypothetical protein JW954_05305 [Dehalococcoidaceae bacterium]|nr:hypothetical protein [Dehalococcoidaceae bacterium]